MEAMAAAVTEKTKLLLINSPNNPTGQVYSKESLDALGRLLKEKSAQFKRTIYLVADEPYRKIIYDDVRIPCIFDSYSDSIMATSYSKDISIPGERIGFAVVNPRGFLRSRPDERHGLDQSHHRLCQCPGADAARGGGNAGRERGCVPVQA